MASQIRTQGEVTGWVDHSHAVIERTRKLLELFLDAETGERGFLLTGEERYLEPYNDARAVLTGRRERLRQLTADNTRQQQRLARLAVVGDLKLTELAKNIRLYRDAGGEAARKVALTDRGQGSMDEIRSLLAQVEAEERTLLRERLQRRHRTAANVAVGASVSTILGLFFLFMTSRQRPRGFAAERLVSQRNRQELQIMRTLVERAPMGIVMLDRCFRVIQVSQRWLDDVGMTREALLGRSHYEGFTDMQERWSELYRRGMAGEALSGNEDSYFTKDGVEHWVNWRIAPWGDGGERTGGIIVYSDDVTKRMRAEQALGASEARYRGLFEHMDRGIAYCRIAADDGTGPDFIYLAVNRQFEALTGLSGVAGKRASEVFPGISALDPELLGTYNAVADGGDPRKFETFVHVLGQWHSISAFSPEKGFFVAVFDVIDERKRAEATARQWQRAFEESHSGIAVANAATGKISAMNAAYSRMLGYAEGELVGRDIAMLYSGEEFAFRESVLRTADSKGGHILFETRHVRKDGGSFPVLIDVTVVRDDAEKPRLLRQDRPRSDGPEARRRSITQSEARALSLFENASQGILITDAQGRIVDANTMVQRLFGYGGSELIGAPVEMLLPLALRERYIRHRAEYLRQPSTRPMGHGLDLSARRKDGTEFPVEISLSHVAEHQGGLSMAFVSDITARKHAEWERENLISSLEGALAEKTVLLQEVHHRVKNNLAVMAALLGMQGNMLEDERATVALAESQQRVLSMARIHEYLYASEHLDRVAFGKYVEELARAVLLVCDRDRSDRHPDRRRRCRPARAPGNSLRPDSERITLERL